jgi:hypothetical protein
VRLPGNDQRRRLQLLRLAAQRLSNAALVPWAQRLLSQHIHHIGHLEEGGAWGKGGGLSMLRCPLVLGTCIVT